MKRFEIVYTKVDEAPELASASFLPIARSFTKAAGITLETRDISLAGRILASFPDRLTPEQKRKDDLAELAELVKTPKANVIKLPNISASIPQLKAAIAELQGQGYDVPDYPENPQSDEERAIQSTYNKIKGSAVNPVLREGNSDRRAPRAVKAYARKNPHSMGEWDSGSKTHVASMDRGDFYSNEKSTTITAQQAGMGRIEFIDSEGKTSVLEEPLPLEEGSVVDSTFMSIAALRAFLEAEMNEAKSQGILFSLHLKATMMKVSDPVIFGHAVSVFFGDLFAKHEKLLFERGIDPNNGLGDLESKIQALPSEERAEIESDIQACLMNGPALHMVNSDKGITNLHVPSDVIIDASMPAIIRAGGKGWDPDGKEQDVKCVIPDNSYAPVYDETISFCKDHGAFDPTEMGSISNVGLMAQKAEEYGSHPHTFIAPWEGTIRLMDAMGEVIHEHDVEKGDIWRSCITKDAPIRDWVRLAVSRARATGAPAVFWLDEKRAHDAQLLIKVRETLADEDVAGLEIDVMAPRQATRNSLERMKRGEDTISVTGNVLRDYLTDLFPILEVGTSAKMLSVVKLMNGGGLFETGAGGSAPKHVQQLLSEGHLRWDSLGEFCALAASLEHCANSSGNRRAAILAAALDGATERLLESNKSPSRKVGEIDNRGSHFYLALYWAEALAKQNDDEELRSHFLPIAEKMRLQEKTILSELETAQGSTVDLGGYYHPDPKKLAAAMRPSPTLNAIIG